MKLTVLVLTLTTIGIFNCVLMPTAAKAIANENNQVVSSKDNVHVEAIKKAIKSYEDAFNSRDTKRLASHWSNEGVYTSQLTGDEIVERGLPGWVSMDSPATVQTIREACEVSTEELDATLPQCP